MGQVNLAKASPASLAEELETSGRELLAMVVKSTLAQKLRELKKVEQVWKPEPQVLLQPNIPKPLHGVNPRTIMGSKWWDATRKIAYASTNYHCIACNTHKSAATLRQWLEAHEEYRINYRKGTCTFIRVIPLCHCCHNYIHSGRLQMLFDNGEIHHSKYATIIRHGDRVLREAGLVKPKPYDGPTAEWSKWRLLFNGRKYKPKYTTEADWLREFNGEE